jgi:hypothetical protein
VLLHVSVKSFTIGRFVDVTFRFRLHN